VDADYARRKPGSFNRIENKFFSKSIALCPLINRQSAQQNAGQIFIRQFPLLAGREMRPFI